MIEVQYQAVGNVLSTNHLGYIISQSHLNCITHPWTLAVQELKQKYLKHFPKKIHSLYVRGSIASGRAIKSFSDLDTIAVMHSPLNDSEYIVAESLKDELLNSYPFIAAMEHDLVLYDEIFPESTTVEGVAFNYAFTIKNLSVCIYGQNLADKFIGFKPDKITALYLMINLNIILTQVKNELAQTKKTEYIMHICRWLCKIIIRNSFLLVMHKENVFTRDLYCCYHFFSKHYPLQRLGMKMVLEYAINPTDVISKIEQIKMLGEWLNDEVEKVFPIHEVADASLRKFEYYLA